MELLQEKLVLLVTNYRVSLGAADEIEDSIPRTYGIAFGLARVVIKPHPIQM